MSVDFIDTPLYSITKNHRTGEIFVWGFLDQKSEECDCVVRTTWCDEKMIVEHYVWSVCRDHRDSAGGRWKGNFDAFGPSNPIRYHVR
jgi:hypothetical protein